MCFTSLLVYIDSFFTCACVFFLYLSMFLTKHHLLPLLLSAQGVCDQAFVCYLSPSLGIPEAMAKDDDIPPGQPSPAKSAKLSAPALSPKKNLDKGNVETGTPHKKPAAHAKGKAKSKAKAKAKSKQLASKAKAKASQKRPAAKQEGAKEKVAKNNVEEWAIGMQGEEAPQEEAEEEQEAEATEEEDRFEVDETKKDRSKDQKFKQLLSQGSLPDWVVQEWNKACKLKVGRTEKQRALVNSILERTQEGKLQLDLDNVKLREVKDKSHKKIVLCIPFHGMKY